MHQSPIPLLVLVLCLFWPLSGRCWTAPILPGTRPVLESPQVPLVDFSKVKIRFQPPPPSYPPLAQIAKIQGTVVLELTIDETGKPEKVVALEGPVQLIPTAEAYARQWLFEPTLIEGVPTKAKFRLTMPFRFRGIPRMERVVLEIATDQVSPTDAEVLERGVRRCLLEAGVVIVEKEKADPLTTHLLNLQVVTVESKEMTHCFGIWVRRSLLSDRNLAENEPGKPPRIWYSRNIAGQKGETGFQERLLEALCKAVRQLSPAEVVPKPLTPASLPGTSKIVVDFDFSQIKVRTQPPAPRYPVAARLAHIQGTVILTITVGPEGLPISAEVTDGPSQLALTAIDYALHWVFEPARLDGKPVSSRFTLTMPFRLR